MNPYLTLKNKHQKEIDEFPLGFAFNDEQFAKMMAKWDLTPDDTDKIYSIGGGGYVRKSDSDALNKLLERHAQEREAAIKENKDDYLYHMFNYELANHEYNYTGEVEPTLNALGITTEMLAENVPMYEALMRAIRHQRSLEW